MVTVLVASFIGLGLCARRFPGDRCPAEELFLHGPVAGGEPAIVVMVKGKALKQLTDTRPLIEELWIVHPRKVRVILAHDASWQNC